MRKILAMATALVLLFLPVAAVPQCIVPANSAVVKTASDTALAADTGKTWVMNCSSACTVTLPSTPQSPNWQLWVVSEGVGAVTVSPNGLNLNGSSSSITMSTNVGSSLQITTDNSNYFAARGDGSRKIASGTAAMGTSAIASATCATVVTVSATGVATTDVISGNPNGDPTGITGYGPSASGSLYIWKYPTTNNVNFKVCNNTSGSITPGALTLNWSVSR